MNPSTPAVRPRAALALAAAVLFAAGCSGTGTVAGKVTLNGAPVTDGVVTFIGADNRQKAAPIDADGGYRIDNPPAGTVQVTVRSLAPPIRTPPGGPPATKGAHLLPPLPPPPQPLPRKYATPNNGLTFVVTRGRQTFDIDLKP
jgi:hypothetical protein